MTSAADLTKANADAILLSSQLSHLVLAIRHARKTHRVIRQNLGWAFSYNLLALPAAALGFIPPYLAALGMSASSLIVVFNALRLSKPLQQVSPNDVESQLPTPQQTPESRS